MPISPPTLTAPILPALVAAGNIGVGTPKLALAIGTGLSIWLGKTSVSITATGTVGAGLVSTPLIVPQPSLLVALSAGFVAARLIGVSAPLLAVGLANGLALSFFQVLVVAPSPTIGAGVGVAKPIAPPAFDSLYLGFEAAQVKGPANLLLVKGLSVALDSLFTVFAQPVQIVGPSGPSPSGGQIKGKLI